MLYSKFGSKLTLISRTEDTSGRLTVQATAEGAADVREYQITDLKADDGLTEINEAVAKLPLKGFRKQPTVGRKAVANPQRRFRPRSN